MHVGEPEKYPSSWLLPGWPDLHSHSTSELVGEHMSLLFSLSLPSKSINLERKGERKGGRKEKLVSRGPCGL